jgi:hypothetical protein
MPDLGTQLRSWLDEADPPLDPRELMSGAPPAVTVRHRAAGWRQAVAAAAAAAVVVLLAVGAVVWLTSGEAHV